MSAERAEAFLRAAAAAALRMDDNGCVSSVQRRHGTKAEDLEQLIGEPLPPVGRSARRLRTTIPSPPVRLAGRDYRLEHSPVRDDVVYLLPLETDSDAASRSATLAGRLRPQVDALVSASAILECTEPVPAGRYRDYVREIGAASRHLLSVVAGTGRPTTTRPPTGTVDLVRIAEQALAMLAMRAADAGITLRRVDALGSGEACGEEGKLLQIFDNLLGNAVKFTQRGGTVGVIVRRQSQAVETIVWDNGPGIPADDQSRVFEKFGRAQGAGAEGTGLGLHIARELARDMGGDLTLDSAPGRGCRFTLSLPLA
jgi:hypothetical protein